MSADHPDFRPDKRWVGRSFGAAAQGYDGVAALQRNVGSVLLSRWPEHIGAPGMILDVGTGTGHFAAELRARHSGACLIALDIAEGMLRAARERLGAAAVRWVCGDAEALPLADGTVDLVFSNLAIQWCASPDVVFREFRRVLRPGGVLLFSTFGPGTLAELRQAWAAVDGYTHVNRFAGVDELGVALRAAGFAEVVLDTRTQCLPYRDVPELMRELKGLGAHNVTAGRPRHLTGKAALRKMISAYPAEMSGGGIRASFETILGGARNIL